MQETIPGPAYCIQTKRLIIRCWKPEDAAMLKKAIDENIDHLKPWMPWAHGEPQELQAKIDLIRRWRGKFDLDEDYVYGIFNPDENRVLGGTGLHTRLGEGALEIGYWIHKDYINQGLATEVSAALTKVAFEINKVKRVEIHCDPANTRSSAVPRKLGFIAEAVLKKRYPIQDGSLRDLMIWTIFESDYPDSPASIAAIQAYDSLGRRML